MIGIFAEQSSTFLRIFAVLTLLPFGLPILLAPLAWARALQWEVDARPDLARYFGRCLGAFIVTLSCAGWYAAGHRELQPFYFAILIAMMAFMVMIHIVGAVERTQPWTETAEIPFWTALLLLSLAFYPTA